MGPRKHAHLPAYDAAPHLGLHEDEDTFILATALTFTAKAIEQRTLGVCPLPILDSPKVDRSLDTIFRRFCKYAQDA